MMDIRFLYINETHQTYLTRREAIQNGVKAPLFYVEMKKSRDNNITLHNALRNALTALTSNNKTLNVLYSGGIDSEIVLRLSRQSRIKVRPVTVDLFGINRYDVANAKKFCQENNFDDHLIIEISEFDFRNNWIPQMIRELETTTYLVSAAYIGAKIMSREGPVVIGGEGPLHVMNRQGHLYFCEWEAALWPHKLRAQCGAPVFDLFGNVEVIHAFIRQPMLQERLGSGFPSDEWTYDGRYLGKEYYYTNSDFGPLRRRFSQHGWEERRGAIGYQKELVSGWQADLSISRGKHYYDRSRAAILLNYILTGHHIDDSDFAKMLFFEKDLPRDVMRGVRPMDFCGNVIFPLFQGGTKEFEYVISTHAGEVLQDTRIPS